MSIELDFPAPSNERRRLLWTRALGEDAQLSPDVDLTLLTGAFRLTGEQIEAAAHTARHTAAWRAAQEGGETCVAMRDLTSACRAHSNQKLGTLTRKIIPRYTWADLVLPADRLAHLHEMCLHVRYSPRVFEEWGFDRKLAGGKGLNVLFAGEPGTGKTMAAEVLAADLGLDMYKLDLSSVVSKYIGETEKNLEQIFREARTSNSILFFDEADSLFGKRSEVKDSHDRYANIEVSYLLQRMECYRGLAILTTNLKKSLDTAFLRRLRFIVEFPFPDHAERAKIWSRVFPADTPTHGLDVHKLARLSVAGGNIRNTALNAAFYAAEAGEPVRMVHCLRAAQGEYGKLEKTLTEAEVAGWV